MFIGPMLAGAGRVAGGVGRGIAAGARAAGRGIKNRAQQGFQSRKDRRQQERSDRVDLEIWRRERQERLQQQGPQQGGLSGGERGAVATGLMGGLAAGAIRGSHRAASKLGESEIGQKSALILIFPVILTVIDYFYGTNGIPLNSIFTGRLEIIELLGRIGTSAPYWAAVIIYWIMKKPQSKEEWIFPLALFMLGFFTLTFGVGSRWVFLHSVFAVITFAYLLDGFNADIKGVHWAFLIMVFMDIFGLATINNLFPDTVLNVNTENQFLSGNISTDIFFNRLLVPYWFFFYLFQIRPGRVKTTIAIGLTLFYTGYGLASIVTPGVLPDAAGLDEQKTAAKNAVVKAVDTWRDTIASWISGRIQYAVTGKVEENQFEPLGVTLENVQSADPRYYEDENVIVWGTVKARTLDDPININVGCFVKKDDKKIPADKTDPDKKFSVFTLEEQDFACTFTKKYNKENKILEPGKKTIKTFADFNFETLAYLKTYFINRERQRAMVREGLDPFEEFAIEDKNPIAVYTNGPAKIEMGTNSPLVSVSSDYIVEPSLDIKIDNREGWQGRINRLKEFVLFLPDGINFDPQQSCGDRKFLDYNLSVCGDDEYSEFNNCCMEGDRNCMACTQSCQNFVVDECKDVCKGFEDNNEKQRCNSDCDERGEVCKKSCASFFVEGGQNYKGYALDVNDIKYRDEEKDFEKGKLFRCRFRPTENVLGASPFTTKSFRVKARYDYTVEKDVSVSIDKIPEEIKRLVGSPKNLRIIDKDGKVVAEGSISLENEITIAWDLSADDGSGSNDIVEYRIYRKKKLEDKWDNIGSVGKGINKFTDKKDLDLTGDFRYYYHVEAKDEDGNWAKSEKMLEITSRKVISLVIDAPKAGEATPVPIAPITPVEAPKSALGVTCGNAPDCTTPENNAKCESGNCGFISNENRCGCVIT